MTDAQLRFHQLVEDTRYHKAQEANWDAQLQETKRSHLASESLSRYATDTQKWSTQVQATTSRYNAELNARTQLQTAETNASASRYATDTRASTEAARLAFDRQTQVYKNAIENQYLSLEQVKAHANVEQIRANTLKALQDVQASMRSLELEAERLGLDKEAQGYRNALTKAQTFAAYAKGGGDVMGIVSDVIGLFKSVWHSPLSVDAN